jgi:hypothetical protein
LGWAMLAVMGVSVGLETIILKHLSHHAMDTKTEKIV